MHLLSSDKSDPNLQFSCSDIPAQENLRMTPDPHSDWSLCRGCGLETRLYIKMLWVFLCINISTYVLIKCIVVLFTSQLLPECAQIRQHGGFVVM